VIDYHLFHFYIYPPNFLLSIYLSSEILLKDIKEITGGEGREEIQWGGKVGLFVWVAFFGGGD
jgi:hypothetical protein